MDGKTLNYWFALKSLKGVGDITALKLLEAFTTPENLFSTSQAELESFKINKSIQQSMQNMDFQQFDSIHQWLDKPQHHFIHYGSSFYPPLLAQTATPPLFLFAIGNLEHLLDPQIAVVGSRNPTPQGIANTQYFCQSLVAHGLTITSGLALGIDGEAHRTALQEKGYTIAVMGTGLDRVYPASHRRLAHSISENGLLISEFFPSERGSSASFPKRNRVIAGLSLGTLVVEAAVKSGSLITAKIAMEEGREVFAVPGSIHNPVAQGCHSLIRQGAKLVDNAEHLLEELPSLAKAHRLLSPKIRPPLNSETADFLKNVDFETTSMDLILTRSQLSIESVTNKLLLLELDGWVINTTGGYIRT